MLSLSLSYTQTDKQTQTQKQPQTLAPGVPAKAINNTSIYTHTLSLCLSTL